MPGSQAPKQGVPLITSLVPEALDISHHSPGTLLEIKGLCNGGPRQVAGSHLSRAGDIRQVSSMPSGSSPGRAQDPGRWGGKDKAEPSPRGERTRQARLQPWKSRAGTQEQDSDPW